MRRLILGMAGLLVAGDALAADYLRGSNYEEVPVAGYNWAGVYIGGQAGYGGTEFRMSNVTASLLDYVNAHDVRAAGFSGLTGPLSVPTTNSRASSYGGFVGYNSQWGDVVIGLEASYNRSNFSITASDERTNGALPPSSARATIAAKLTDYGTLRARAGYAAGWLMPYGFVGVAVARGEYVKTVDIVSAMPLLPATSSVQCADVSAFAIRCAEAKSGAIFYGYTAGLGVDIGLFRNLFVRAEYEFVQLNKLNGITPHMNNLRVAAALKF